MAIVKKGGSNPYAGQVMTTMGYRQRRAPRCMRCGERREGQIYTVNANGQEVCADCASPSSREILTGFCDPDNDSCGCTQDDPDPAAA